MAFPTFSSLKANNSLVPAGSFSATSNYGGSSITLNASVAPPEMLRITLDEAQQMAGGASNPLVRLAALQVRAAKEHRLGVQSMYFPNIGGQLENLHFNKNTGPVFTVRGPFGNQRSVAANIVSQESDRFQLLRDSTGHASFRGPSACENRAVRRDHREGKSRGPCGGNSEQGRDKLLQFDDRST